MEKHGETREEQHLSMVAIMEPVLKEVHGMADLIADFEINNGQMATQLSNEQILIKKHKLLVKRLKKRLIEVEKERDLVRANV